MDGGAVLRNTSDQASNINTASSSRPQLLLVPAGCFIAYGVTRTDYEDGGSEVGETDGGDLDFDF